MLAIPLLREGTAIGTFTLTRDEVNPFTEKQKELATTFADQAVIAIENVRLFEEVQARTRDLTESWSSRRRLRKCLKVISSSPGELEAGFEPCWRTQRVSARPSSVFCSAMKMVRFTSAAMLQRTAGTCGISSATRAHLRHRSNSLAVDRRLKHRRYHPRPWTRHQNQILARQPRFGGARSLAHSADAQGE